MQCIGGDCERHTSSLPVMDRSADQSGPRAPPVHGLSDDMFPTSVNSHNYYVTTRQEIYRKHNKNQNTMK